MKTVAIFGSTGTVGRNTLQVVSRFADKFKVIALTAGGNAELFAEQINGFCPQLAAINDESKVTALSSQIKTGTKLFGGEQGMDAAAECGADITVMAVAGSRALAPTLKSLEKSRRLALANKECLVMAGDIIMRKARENNTEIIPVDSEHNAIFQCLKDETPDRLDKIYLTGSGGPLKDKTLPEIESVPPHIALRHPHWKMGKKITIDSATLMNKGLEIIEAGYLFDFPVEKIEVLIHPEAVIHSLVQFIDGTILAHLAHPDMRVPIQYALTYPERFPAEVERLDFLRLNHLSFQAPDLVRFPCLGLAMAAAREKGLAGCVLNACDEECVLAYLDGKIRLTDIARIIENVLAKLRNKESPGLKEILDADCWAREETKSIIDGHTL
ncbi:MAG: 1-deoxy-D-xylulose-5-phosphate reductoisomerase [Candidatus Omnitrophota bacterium]